MAVTKKFLALWKFLSRLFGTNKLAYKSGHRRLQSRSILFSKGSSDK